MNDTEKEGCRKLLNMLKHDELSSLVGTTTKKQISFTRPSDTIEAIIEYTPSAIDLLKRKKVKRDLLLKFLAEQKEIVPVDLDKSGLIKMILKKWGTKIQDDFMDIDHDEDKQTSTQTRNQNSQDAGNQSFDSRSQSLSPYMTSATEVESSLTSDTMKSLGTFDTTSCSRTSGNNAPQRQNDKKRTENKKNTDDHTEKVLNLLEDQTATLKLILEEQKKTNKILSQLFAVNVEP